MDRLILARHGEYELNPQGRLNGDPTVAFGLTDKGVEEAQRLGGLLEDVEIDLCVVTEFQRTLETAYLALRDRDVPQLVVPELGDPRFGRYEGRTLTEFREWVAASPSSAVPGIGGESRADVVGRYVTGFRVLLERPEKTVFAVAHSLTVAYALAARGGEVPGVHIPLASYAEPYEFTPRELERVIAVLSEWHANPTW